MCNLPIKNKESANIPNDVSSKCPVQFGVCWQENFATSEYIWKSLNKGKCIKSMTYLEKIPYLSNTLFHMHKC